jgi:hypothetical protein
MTAMSVYIFLKIFGAISLKINLHLIIIIYNLINYILIISLLSKYFLYHISFYQLEYLNSLSHEKSLSYSLIQWQ